MIVSSDSPENFDGRDEHEGEDAVDGRSARRDRNRTAVLDAVIEVFSENNLAPGPEEVAMRVGLSTRSVYRYFEDRDELVRAAIDRQRQIMLPMFRIHEIGQGSFDVRLDRFLKSRLDIYELGAASIRASWVRASFDDVIREQQDVHRTAFRNQILLQFAVEIEGLGPEGVEAAEAVNALVQFETLDHLRVHRGLDRSEVTALLKRSFQRLLAG